MLPSRRNRALVAVLLGLSIGALVTLAWEPRFGARRLSDFYQLWLGARALLSGDDPYIAVGLSRWRWPLFYPLPAVLAAIPFAPLPLTLARGIFVGLGAALLAYVITARAWWPLLMFCSGSYAAVVLTAQWSPYFMAALFWPALGPLLAVKPSLGAIVWSYRPMARAVIGGGVLLLTSVAVWPVWPLEWYAAVHNAPMLRPALAWPLGVLLLAAALRWRRPEARMILLACVVPHTFALQETLPLFLGMYSKREMMILAATTMVAHVAALVLIGGVTTVAALRANALFHVSLVYLPAIVMLFRRPNVSEWPSWIPWHQQSPKPELNTAAA
jgi:hypothetical protein